MDAGKNKKQKTDPVNGRSFLCAFHSTSTTLYNKEGGRGGVNSQNSFNTAISGEMGSKKKNAR